ncbi:hypothetical protein RclHR1_09930007 [Rhizophagus clarus]|uniref:Uncharacterized protein n=1 Tax=Rhizophagus clarus TaxID=94130 RepID=A0A2Z6SJI2_9GLOM|nr:hypothetical protein RclHR1_09930007 [Rhizophagus clarus]GES92665.1 hypothetical protein GLOIN_2v1473325 [Rhizophagus clarus]
MDKLEKTDKMLFDKVVFELEQENKKLVNRIELEKWISDGCLFEEDEDVLDLIEFKTREREACENGASITHSGLTGTGKSNSVTCRGHDDGSKICTSDRTTLMLRKTSSLITSTNWTWTTKFRGFRSGNISSPGKISERNDKRFGTTKSVESNHWVKQEYHH